MAFVLTWNAQVGHFFWVKVGFLGDIISDFVIFGNILSDFDNIW